MAKLAMVYSNSILKTIKKITMKNLILLIFILPSIAYGQFGVDYNQSSLPFLGVNYEIKDKIRPEMRIGTDNFFNDITLEGIVTYDILNTENHEFYLGLGVRGQLFAGLVVPVGLNFYPFPTKDFGFQIEIAPIIGNSNILRGSWGIRYRFNNSN